MRWWVRHYWPAWREQNRAGWVCPICLVNEKDPAAVALCPTYEGAL